MLKQYFRKCSKYLHYRPNYNFKKNNPFKFYKKNTIVDLLFILCTYSIGAKNPTVLNIAHAFVNC